MHIFVSAWEATSVVAAFEHEPAQLLREAVLDAVGGDAESARHLGVDFGLVEAEGFSNLQTVGLYN